MASTMYNQRQSNHPSQIPPQIQNAIIASVSEAERFARRFFFTLDNSASSANAPIAAYLAPDAAIIWNGSPVQGRDGFVQLAAALPADCKHEVSCFDVHPLNASKQSIVNASGKVKIGNERGKNLFGFAAVFRLVQDPTDASGDVHISSMSYRYTYRPDDATVVA